MRDWHACTSQQPWEQLRLPVRLCWGCHFFISLWRAALRLQYKNELSICNETFAPVLKMLAGKLATFRGHGCRLVPAHSLTTSYLVVPFSRQICHDKVTLDMIKRIVGFRNPVGYWGKGFWPTLLYLKLPALFQAKMLALLNSVEENFHKRRQHADLHRLWHSIQLILYPGLFWRIR